MSDADLLARIEAALTQAWALRARTDADLPLLAELYAQTREEELRAVPWSAEQKQAFLLDQFGKQHAHYLQHYPDALWRVITCRGHFAGRLYLSPSESDLRIMDLSLVAQLRGHGIGTTLMRAVLDAARQSGRTASLHVEPFNPALRLYQRLGFRHEETRGIYHFMTWKRSVEDDLVPDATGVSADRHDEQVEPAVHGV